MFRVLSCLLTLSLTLTPAVVGACAALFCGSGELQVAQHEGHEGRPLPARTDAHDHHAMGHAASAVPPSSHLRAVPDHDCCTTANRPALGVAAVTTRPDAGVATGSAVVTSPLVFVAPEGGSHSPPPRDRRVVRPSVSAPLILRI